VRRFCGLVAAGLLLGLGAGGCATPRAREPEVVVSGSGQIRVEFVEWHEETSDLLKQAVPRAAKVLDRWGGLSEPVRITVVNSHWELEETVGRPLPGISAWARRNQVVLWDPRWWPLAPGVEEHGPLAAQIRATQVTDLLKHELTHSLMFQRAGGPPWDPANRIPFWFREGMATVTAGEGSQWPPPESLAQWLSSHPGVDLLKDAPKLVRTHPEIAYGAAFHAFQFLEGRYGDATVLRILDRMRVREGFPDSFKEILGISVQSFATDFRRYLQWRGFH
jgi:hypothetical protein